MWVPKKMGPTAEGLKKARLRAEGFGYKVELVSRKAQDFSDIVRSRYIRINGRLCGIHYMTKAFARTGGKRQGTWTQLRLTEVKVTAAQIFFVVVSGLDEMSFVIPSTVLKETLFDPKKLEYTSIFFPLEDPLNTSGRPRIDVSEYMEAWHLLR